MKNFRFVTSSEIYTVCDAIVTISYSVRGSVLKFKKACLVVANHSALIYSVRSSGDANIPVFMH